MKDFSVAEAQPFFFRGGDHGVLLIHGFTGSAAHMRMLGDHLRDAGFTVMGINLPGHASSMEEMGKTGDQEWIGAARAALAQLRTKCGRVSVAGLSMGGCISLILAEEQDLTAVVTISAPMDVQNRMMYFAGPASLVMKDFQWAHQPNRVKQLDQRYDLGYPGFPTRCAVSLTRIIRKARGGLKKVTCPILAVQSHGDETISPDSSEVILNSVSSERKESLWLQDVPHVCTISREHRYIADTVARFLREAESRG